MKLNSRLKTKDKIEKNNKRQTENDVNLHNKQAQIIENSLNSISLFIKFYWPHWASIIWWLKKEDRWVLSFLPGHLMAVVETHIGSNEIKLI